MSDTLSRLIKKFDLFGITQFVRYKGEGHFRTATGGFVSLAIVVILFIIYANYGLQILNKKEIISSTVIKNEVDPSNFTVAFNPSNKFMLAISFINLQTKSALVNYFSVALYPKFMKNQLDASYQDPIYFVACTSEHFAYNQQTSSAYDRMRLNNSLCPPLGYQTYVGGKQSSKLFSYFTLVVLRCNSSTNSNCVNDTQFEQTFNTTSILKMQIPYINTMVNPGLEVYQQTYYQDQNFYYLNLISPTYVESFIENFIINTDQSILPYTNIQTEEITAISNPFIQQTRPSDSNFYGNAYAQITFSKSSKAITYTRSFTKIDVYFSYIGGLVGTLVGVFFIMNSYSESAYLISIAQKVFNYDGQSNIQSKGYNFGYFCTMTLKKIFNQCCIIQWQKTDMFLKSSQQMSEQLSIELLLEKISFLEQAVSSLLTEHQLEVLYLKEKRPILKQQFARKKYKTSRDLFAELLQKMKLQNIQTIEKNEEVFGHQRAQSQKLGKMERNNLNEANDQTGKQLQCNPNFNSQITKQNENNQEERSKQQTMQQLKNILFRVISQGKKGDETSRRIIEKANKKMLKQIGLSSLRDQRQELNWKKESNSLIIEEIEVISDCPSFEEQILE